VHRYSVVRCGSRPSHLSLIIAALTVLSTIISVEVPLAQPAGGLIDANVRSRVLGGERVRVIAELNLSAGPHRPEGTLSDAGVAAQRNDIASARRQVLARLAGRSHRVIHEYETVPLLALEIGADAMTELEASPAWVARVVPDTLNRPSLPDSVPLIGGNTAWSHGFDGTGTMVAILDTGVESTHPFLTGRVTEEACYSSNTGGSTTLCPNGSTQQTGPGAAVPCTLNLCWHGTHVAGIAAGNGATAGVPFSGVAKGAQIMAVQVFSELPASQCGGSSPCVEAWTSDIIAGLERVYALRSIHAFASANLSLGSGTSATPCDGDPTKTIIDNLRSAGIATVIAAGNGGSVNGISAPGCISSAISVGATTKTDVVASFSNVASFMSLFAPGVSIYSSLTGGGFGSLSGTSMATPHVTGAWAVLKQAAPAASVDQVLSALQNTGLPISDTRAGGSVTKPRIRIDQALATFVPIAVTVSSVAPASGAQTATMSVTVSGSGFKTGASMSAGAGISVTNATVTSGTQLSATLTIASTAAPGTRDVTVTNPDGTAGTLTGGFAVTAAPNPVPTISALAPSTATAGGPAFTLTVTGGGFITSSVVRWNGNDRATTFISATQLQASISAGDIVAAGTAQITVFTPAPGGGTSGQLPFSITTGTGGSGGVSGLVGAWAFDEGGGSIARDSSGNSNTGTLTNAPTWTTGKVGGAIQLNGWDQGVQVPDSPTLNITGQALTLASWIYPTATQSGTIIHKDYHYSLFRNADGSISYADSALWSYAAVGSYGQTPINAWSHVAVTFDGSAIRFYVNGQLIGTVPRIGTLTANTNPLYLGSYAGYVGSYRFAGRLDDARVYSRALSAQEVAALASGNLPPVISSVTASPASIQDSQTSQLSVAASDPDNGPAPLTYSWSVPAGMGTLSNASAAAPVFTPAPVTAVRVVTIGVTTSDGAATATGSVNVTVSPSSSGSGTPGLAGYWTFDEGTGSVAADSSGNGNTGTLSNNPIWATGKNGGAIQLDGATQDVRVADSPSLSISGTGLTLATWIYPTAQQSGALLHKDYQYSLFRNADGSISYADSALWSYAAIGNYGQTPLNAWSHVAVTYDGTAIRFYVNGQMVGAVPHAGALTDNANPLYIGSYAGAYHFAGRFDEARVYSRALTAQEIASLSAGGGAGPAGYWKFDDGSGSVAVDASSNGNTGSLTNAPTWTLGKIGGAIQLDGVSQDVRVADSPSLSITGTGLTVATWIYPTATQPGALLHKDYHYSVFRSADGSITYADSALWSYAAVGSYGQTPLNTWSHVVVTYDGSTIRFYVNGQPVGSVPHTGALTDTANPLYIGSYAGASYRFAGKVDEARVYNRALSAQEVANLYAVAN